jgi:hypothetical protein
MLAQWEVSMTWRGSMITSVGGEVAREETMLIELT